MTETEGVAGTESNLDLGDEHQTSKDAGSHGLFLVGGVIKQLVTTSDAFVVGEYLSSLLQVKNLVVLLGSGASFHLGSPQTRDLTNQQVLDLIAKAGGVTSDPDALLLATINPGDNGDLEQLLNGLQLATSLATQAGQDRVALGGGENANPTQRIMSTSSGEA